MRNQRTSRYVPASLPDRALKADWIRTFNAASLFYGSFDMYVGIHLNAAPPHRSCAYGTAASLTTGSKIDYRLPRVPFCALPPDLPVRSRHEVTGRQISVLGGMPLGGQSRILGCQIIFANYCSFSGTERSVGLLHRPVADCHQPFMSLFAAPPDPLSVPIGNTVGVRGLFLF